MVNGSQRSTAALLCALCVYVCGLSGCADDATQIMVAIRTDLRVPPATAQELDHVRIEVSRTPTAAETKTVEVPLDADTAWPLTLAVLPPDGEDTAFLRVTGLYEETPVVSQTAFVTFQSTERRMLIVDLLRSCLDAECDSGETCISGTCSTEDRRAELLPPWTGEAPEALAPPKVCSGTWGGIVEVSVTENNDYDDDPSFTSDLLEFYFASNRDGIGGEDIYVSTRATTNDAWGAPTVVPNVNGEGAEETAQISRDGLRLWFSRFATPTNKDIYLSTRETRQSPWTAPVVVRFWDESEVTSNDRDVGEVGDGDTIVFSSQHIDPGTTYEDYDLYITKRAGGGDDPTQWMPPVRLSQVSTDGANEMGPFPSLDGSRLYFHRQVGAGGDSQLYVAERAGASGEYGEATLIEELSIAENSYDQDINVSDDECFAMYAREYEDPIKGQVSNVYVASRTE
jgi:hypothetical protein